METEERKKKIAELHKLLTQHKKAVQFLDNPKIALSLKEQHIDRYKNLLDKINNLMEELEK